MQKISTEKIESALEDLPGWHYHEDRIERNFEFADFSEAFAFLSRVALLSEKLNHHPNWSGVYNEVALALTTHDAGGVTERDLKFAREVDKMLG